MDADSFGIVLRLLSEDLGSIAAESKGKGREGTTSDAELARILFEDELTQSTAFLADHIMARSIALAVERDGAVIAGFTASEQQAASDHAHACRLAGVSNTPSVPPQAAVPKPCEVSDDLITELIKFNITKYASFNVDDEDDCPAGPSTWPSERDKEKPETKRCEACQEDHPVDTITKVCCGHCYCRECLQELFTASMTDESLFPPRCCRQPIPCGTFDLALPGGDLRFQFLIRKEETESQDRTYCTRTDCNKYIPKVSIKGDVATCTYCKTKTCTHCKSAEHAGACPQDESYQLLVQVAREQGWQQCFSCKRFVELSTGCNHITCPCGAQFCYLCGDKWKTCRCAQWEEANLLNRAERLVDRDRAIGQDNARRLNAVADAVRNLRRNHACNHTRYDWVGGPHECEECHTRLPVFTMECRQCHLQVCRRCMRHRL